MKRQLFILLSLALAALTFTPPSFACFDTYCFIRKHGMTYERGLLAVETNGEYLIGDLAMNQPDVFAGNLNVYYGLARRFSMQASLSSAEKERTQFQFDEWGLRGVYGLIRQHRGIYNLDLILEHRVSTAEEMRLYEVSSPGIMHWRSLTMVAHPVVAFGPGLDPAARGHTGIFYSVGAGTIVGLGAEYESAQSSANFGRRLIKGDTGTSLFYGSAIGKNLFVQNELIKGWGATANDIGFSLTLKLLIPTKR